MHIQKYLLAICLVLVLVSNVVHTKGPSFDFSSFSSLVDILSGTDNQDAYQAKKQMKGIGVIPKQESEHLRHQKKDPIKQKGAKHEDQQVPSAGKYFDFDHLSLLDRFKEWKKSKHESYST